MAPPVAARTGLTRREVVLNGKTVVYYEGGSGPTLVFFHGGGTWEGIDFASGRVLNPRFSQYRVPRFGDVPEIEVVLVDRRDLPSAGAGETPITGIAPAVGNAIVAATGTRLRSLPMVPDGLKN